MSSLVMYGKIKRLLAFSIARKNLTAVPSACKCATLAVAPELMLHVTDSMFLARKVLGLYHL